MKEKNYNNAINRRSLSKHALTINYTAETLFKTNATLYHRSLEIARHTSPSDAQYLNINLL